MSPRVLFMCSALPTGGAERQWATLLPGLTSRGLDVRLLTLTGRGRFFDEIAAAGIPSACAEMTSRFDVRGMRRAFRLVGPKPDLVVTHEPNALVLGHVVADRAKAAHVVVNHRAAGRKVAFHRRVVERLVAPRVDRLIAVSGSQVQELADHGFDPTRIDVVHNGVAPLEPRRSRGEVRDSLGLREEDVVALLVAALRPVKRADVFVQAVAAAHSIDERIAGLVAGGGESLEALRTLAAETGSPVQLLGERSDVADLMAAADVVCLTSAIETSPIALLEAMSLGRPVVAPARGGTREVVLDGQTGLLVGSPDKAPAAAQFAEALASLAADVAWARTLGVAGRERYERLFTADRMIDEYAEILAQLAASGRSGPGAAG